MKDKLSIICSVTILACILLAIIIGLLAIWTSIDPATLKKGFYSVLLLFAGALILIGLVEGGNKLKSNKDTSQDKI